MLEKIKSDTRKAVCELLDKANLSEGDILVVGCSSSEIIGKKIGTCGSDETALAVFEVISSIINERKLFLAAQCCEHLNRTIIIERKSLAVHNLTEVNVVPFPNAGGAFATVAYKNFENPVAVEKIRASAGIDIGGTLIGMHLKEVAVPVRVSIDKIGEAPIILARTRPKFVGGERAHYNEELL